MATDITCPSCKHWWVDDDRFDEVDLEDAKADIEEKLATREQHLGEMREFLQSLVDEFDTTPGAYAVSRVFTKAEIQRMRRLVEE